MISVLYVDDEVSLLDISKLFLERTGEFLVDTESSAAGGLDTLGKKHYDAVISDYQMPGMDGIEFLKHIRKKYPDLPFIIFTGKGREEIAIAAFENGADFYIQKGGDPRAQFAELAHKIRKSVEQRAAEQALKDSETRFRSLIQNTSDIIRILDSEGKIIYDSPAASRILRYPENFFIGKNPLDFIHPEDRERILRDLEEVIGRTNTGTPTEFRIRRADGDYVDAESTAMNLIGVKGVDGIVITTRVITERKRAERALRESEEKYRDLYDNAPNAYFSFGTDGRIARCNKLAGTILGVHWREAVGKNIADFFAPTGLGIEKARRLFSEFMSGNEILDEELQVQQADGNLIWISLTLNGVLDSQGTITGIRAIITDITGRKAMEDELRMANRKLHLLYSITRHDIRNQLLNLRSAIELVEPDDLDQKARKWIGVAKKAAETINTQIEFTREYEHLGMKELGWQNVAGVFRQAVLQFLMCDISLGMPAGDYEIFADPLLEKVFHNLIDNALRHGGNVTRIDLDCRETDAGLVISLEDNGVGVTGEDKLLIFDQNFGRNTGLGLFLSREILAITGISIAETGTFGKGAHFEIVVPKGKYRISPRSV